MALAVIVHVIRSVRSLLDTIRTVITISPTTSIIISLIPDITPYWLLNWGMTDNLYQVSPETCIITLLSHIRAIRMNAPSLRRPATRATICLTLATLLLQCLNYASLCNTVTYFPGCLNYFSKRNVSWCSYGGANLKWMTLLKLFTSFSHHQLQM